MEYEIHVGACRWRIGDLKVGHVIAFVEDNNEIKKSTTLYLLTDFRQDDKVLAVDLDTGAHKLTQKDVYVIYLKQTHKPIFTTKNLIPSSGPAVQD